MSHEYPHIYEDYQRYMALDKESRVKSLYEPVWISYARSNQIMHLMRDYMNRPKKPRMPSLLIVGDSHMGKTSLIKQFRKLHPDITYEDDEKMAKVQKHVIIATMQGHDEKGLYLGILEQFWTPFRPTDQMVKLRHQALYLMRECNVKMLILDEIHNLLSGTPSKQRMAMNAIKNLSNELMIPIVGVGTQDASLILTTDPQHASRFDVVTLPCFELNLDFLGVLGAFEKALPLQKPSMLYAKEKASLLHTISGGNLGDLHRLLIDCTAYAIREDIEEITVDIIKKFQWYKPSSTRTGRELNLDSYPASDL